MKLAGGVSLLLLVLESQRCHDVEAFAPSTARVRQSTARAFSPMMDPSHLPDLPNHIQSLQDAFSSISLADLDVDALTSGASRAAADAASAASGAVQAVDPSGAVVEGAAKSGNGWFGFLTGPTMMVLQGIHSGLVAVGVSSDSWGVSIIALTVLIKLVTFPLTKAQLESTNKMQVGEDILIARVVVDAVVLNSNSRSSKRIQPQTTNLQFEMQSLTLAFPSPISLT